VILVVDASVAVKWFLADSPDEDRADIAIGIFEQAVFGSYRLLQPSHFIAEVAAVLARIQPGTAQSSLLNLIDIERQTADRPDIYASAVQLATSLNHHLFDTLYHAVALQTPGATLVTADRRYFDKARHLGQITWLADFVFA